MTTQHGARASLWVAQYAIAPYGNAIEAHMKHDVVDVSSQGQTPPFVKSFIPGLLSWTKSQKGFYDGAVGALDDILTSLLYTQTQIILGPAGGAAGGIAKAAYGSIQDGFNISSPVNGAVGYDLSMVGNQIFRRCKIIRNATLTGAGNGAAYDLGAAGTQGVEGFLVVTAFTGTNATIKIQSSADGATGWADRVTFTVVTGATYERMVSGTTTDRYHRLAVT